VKTTFVCYSFTLFFLRGDSDKIGAKSQLTAAEVAMHMHCLNLWTSVVILSRFTHFLPLSCYLGNRDVVPNLLRLHRNVRYVVIFSNEKKFRLKIVA